jgi:hypothetical protein
MQWLKHLLGKPSSAEARFERNISFLGEQDGEPERELKSQWRTILAGYPNVTRAYLAIVSFDGVAGTPALCISSRSSETPQLVDALAAPFQQLFNKQVFLEIMFMSEEQEYQVRNVCRPFYEAA